MGNHQANPEQFSRKDWVQVSTSPHMVTLWQNTGNRHIHIEQFRVYTTDHEQLMHEKQWYFSRKNHQYWVAAYYFQEERNDEFCVSRSVAHIFIEKIPVRICDLRDLPLTDLLHVYNQCLQGYMEFARRMGCFRVQSEYIGVNERGVVKVWAGPQWSHIGVIGNRINQEEMVRSILQCLEGSVDQMVQTSHFSIKNYLYRNSDRLSFEEALSQLHGLANQYNNGRIPTRLESLQHTSNFQQFLDPLLRSNHYNQDPARSLGSSLNHNLPSNTVTTVPYATPSHEPITTFRKVEMPIGTVNHTYLTEETKPEPKKPFFSFLGCSGEDDWMTRTVKHDPLVPTNLTSPLHTNFNNQFQSEQYQNNRNAQHSLNGGAIYHYPQANQRIEINDHALGRKQPQNNQQYLQPPSDRQLLGQTSHPKLISSIKFNHNEIPVQYAHNSNGFGQPQLQHQPQYHPQQQPLLQYQSQHQPQPQLLYQTQNLPQYQSQHYPQYQPQPQPQIHIQQQPQTNQVQTLNLATSNVKKVPSPHVLQGAYEGYQPVPNVLPSRQGQPQRRKTKAIPQSIIMQLYNQNDKFRGFESLQSGNKQFGFVKRADSLIESPTKFDSATIIKEGHEGTIMGIPNYQYGNITSDLHPIQELTSEYWRNDNSVSSTPARQRSELQSWNDNYSNGLPKFSQRKGDPALDTNDGRTSQEFLRNLKGLNTGDNKGQGYQLYDESANRGGNRSLSSIGTTGYGSTKPQLGYNYGLEHR